MSNLKDNDQKIKLIFVLPDKSKKEVFANLGDTILDVAILNDLPIEGACGGSLACCTCHVVIDSFYFEGNLCEISDIENDMLDMIPNLQKTSRLGCQVKVTEAMDNIVIFIQDDGNFCGR